MDGVDGLEFCSVFGNLMDNAIEAERTVADGKKIEILIEEKMGYLRLLVQNKIDRSVLKENPELRTTKKTEGVHGIGHKSVEWTMQKMGGAVKYYEKDGMFCAETVFPVK